MLARVLSKLVIMVFLSQWAVYFLNLADFAIFQLCSSASRSLPASFPIVVRN